MVGCASQPVEHSSHGKVYGPSQINEMKAYGLHRIEYKLGMELIPCMKLINNSHEKLTMAERFTLLEERKSKTYLADCGVIDDNYVWSK